MSRLPIIPTIVVALAVAAMVALGIWQLDRRHQKEAQLARYAANEQAPPVAFPAIPTDQSLLYRKTQAFCLKVTRWEVLGAGSGGWRFIAHCATGAEGPGFAAEMGQSHDPNAKPGWKGGEVSGTIAEAPNGASLIATMLGRAPVPTLMIVADPPMPGFAKSPRPDPASIPNNHLAYAIQWFIFAGIAVIIYVLALRRRLVRRRGQD